MNPQGRAFPEKFQEKRAHNRVTIIQEIECELANARFYKRLADISVGGAFVDKLTSVLPGDIINVRFRLASRDEPILTAAKVLYVQDTIGTGIKFLELKPQDRTKIQRIVDRLTNTGVEVGKLSRVLVKMPVILSGRDSAGRDFDEKTYIIALSKNFTCVRTGKTLILGSPVYLSTAKGSQFEGRVTRLQKEELWIQCRGLAHAFGFNFP